MKISLNWLKKYVDITVPDDELVRLIGARLVEVEDVIDETHKYDNIYIVRVEKAEKIPDTHLTLCQINVGFFLFILIIISIYFCKRHRWCSNFSIIIV